MKQHQLLVIGLLGVAALGLAADEAVTVRRARNWQLNASEGSCDIRVRVDGEAEFGLRGETLTMRTLTGDLARDAGSECTTPLPPNVVDFRFKGIDGRGEVSLLEGPSARNRWMAVVRIRDNKGGAEEYHYRLQWGRGSSFGAGAGARSGNAGSSWNSLDAGRMRTRELRREIERMYETIYSRRPTNDVVDDYIDRVRFDRWSLDQVQSEIERRR